MGVPPQVHHLEARPSREGRGMSAPSFRALADLARAQHVLQADGEDLQAIAALLGIAGIAAPPDAPPAPVPVTPDRHIRIDDQGKATDQVKRRETAAPEKTSRPSPIPQSSPSEEIHAVLTPDFTARQPPEWLSKARRLETAGAPAAPPVLEPLFLPRWTRAILSGSLSREG